jgi:predicted esterase
MRGRFIIILFVALQIGFIGNLMSQNFCESQRFIKADFFDESVITFDTNLVYGSAIDWKGREDVQKFHIFYPKPGNDPIKQRPFIMLMHGGGFKPEDDFSNKNQWNELCKLFAKRGFVAATIDYRVGWDDRKKKWKDYTPEERKNSTGVKAIYRANQDARAALRYFVSNAARFGIDTNNIFIGGRSAGGDLSLATAFMTQRNLDSTLYTVIPIDCHKLFGSLDSSTNNLKNKFRIRAVANMWGPIPDTAFISEAEARSIPIIMFHGTDDQSVPYKKWETDNFPFVQYGSFFIAQRYKHLGACYELNTKINGDHGEDFWNDFLAERMSLFFKNVMCNTCKSGEFESDVSLKWKLHLFFSSGAVMNLIVVLAVIAVVFFIFKTLRKKKVKSLGNSNL